MAETSRCPVRPGFDPLGAEYLADPLAVLGTLPGVGKSIFYAPTLDYYVITRHADIAEVFRDPATYSAAAAQLPLVALEPEAGQILLDGGHKPQPSMVSLDQPEHTRLRRPATRAFTASRVQAMEPEIRARVDSLLDAVGDAQSFDLVEVLCFPLPADTIFSLMGVPREDYARLREWCGSRAALARGRPAPEEQVDIAPGTQPEEVLTLRARGVPHLRGTGRGDLHVHLEVKVPTRLDGEQERLLRELATLRGEERPGNTGKGSGLFGRRRR